MASRVVRARLDRPSEEGLALLMREGRTESEAVRLALVEHAERPRGDGRHGGPALRLAGATRGDVHRLRLPPGAGHEQHGPRFAVVVQADEFLGLSMALIAPTFRRSAAVTFRRPDRGRGHTSPGRAPARRGHRVCLGENAGRLSHAELRSADEALMTVLGL